MKCDWKKWMILWMLLGVIAAWGRMGIWNVMAAEDRVSAGEEKSASRITEVWLETHDGTKYDTTCIGDEAKKEAYCFFFDENAYLMVSVRDAFSDEALSVQAEYRSDTGGKPLTESMTSHQGKAYMALLPENFRGNVSVKILDAAGHVSETYEIAGKILCESAKDHRNNSCVEGTMTDTDARNKEGLPLYETEPVVSVILQDEISGIRQVEWEITGTPDTSEIFCEKKIMIDQKGNITGDQTGMTSVSRRANLITGLQIREKQKLTDGAYRFWIRMTDGAGHRSQWSSSYVVDTTDPQITVSGVSQDGVYNSAVCPVITCEDENYQAGSLQVKLISKSQGTLWEYCQQETSSSNVRCEVPWFRNHTGINADGFYELQITAGDLAGHRTERQAAFLVNRYGSVYAFSKETQAVNGTYLTSAPDLVFTESNLSPLVSENIVVKINHNGTIRELIPETDYRIEHKEENGWNVYTYTLKKEVFAKDGTYSIFAESKDAASNQNASCSQAKLSLGRGAELTFAIDRTAPKILALQGEKGEVVFKITDNLKLKNIHIYAGEEELPYTMDGDTCRVKLPLDKANAVLCVQAEDEAGNKKEDINMSQYPIAENTKEILGHIEEGSIQYKNSGFIFVLGICIAILCGVVIYLIRKFMR